MTGSILRSAGLHRLCEGVLGIVFAAAALSKLGKPSGFSELVSNYQILPVASNLVAITLPWIELVVALALLAGFWSDAATGLAAGLTLLFLAGMGSALARGLEIDCGCFGGNDPLTPWTFLRDGLLLVLPLLPLLFFRRAANHPE